MIMEKVRAEVPCDDSTLQAMSICYREIHQREFRSTSNIGQRFFVHRSAISLLWNASARVIRLPMLAEILSKKL